MTMGVVIIRVSSYPSLSFTEARYSIDTITSCSLFSAISMFILKCLPKIRPWIFIFNK